MLATGSPQASLLLAVVGLNFSPKHLATLDALRGPVAVPADTRNVSEMQSLGPHPSPTESEPAFQ